MEFLFADIARILKCDRDYAIEIYEIIDNARDFALQDWDAMTDEELTFWANWANEITKTETY